MKYCLPPLEETWVGHAAGETYLFWRFNGESGFISTFRGTSRSFERPCYAQSNSDVHVEFTPWRMSQSQFRYRGQPNVIDLG
jgi:hypothetical protein